METERLSRSPAEAVRRWAGAIQEVKRAKRTGKPSPPVPPRGQADDCSASSARRLFESQPCKFSGGLLGYCRTTSACQFGDRTAVCGIDGRKHLCRRYKEQIAWQSSTTSSITRIDTCKARRMRWGWPTSRSIPTPDGFSWRGGSFRRGEAGGRCCTLHGKRQHDRALSARAWLRPPAERAVL